MPYNGTGIFNRVYQWVNDAALGIFVDATRTDTDSNDIAAGLTNCVTRDGQSPWLANLPAGGFKITNLATGTQPTDSVNYAQVFVAPVFTGGITYSGGMTGSGGMTITGAVDLDGASSVTVPTAAPGDNSTKAASTAFATQLAFQTTLPAQTGNANKFLQTDGTNASWQKAGSLIYLSTVTATGAATVDIETGFSSTYDDYVIVASAFRTSVGLTNVGMTMKIGGSYLVAGYDGLLIYATDSVPTRQTIASTNAASAVISPGAISSGNGATSFTMEVFDVNSSSAHAAKGSGLTYSTATPALYTLDFVAGCRTTGVLSGIRLAAASGTITGTFRLYGRAKV